jgi:hypothetical protein
VGSISWSPEGRAAARRWLPAAAALLAGAALAALLFLPPAARGRIGGGAAYLFATYALALAIFGLGVALVQAPQRRAILGILLFAAGLLAGLVVKEPVLSMLVARPGAFEWTALIAPTACILAGLAIAVPALAPGVAALAGIATGFLIALNDPTFGETQFAAGAAAAAFWLLLAPPALLSWLDARAVRIGSRILASWLVAIGLMLGAARLYERPPPPTIAPGSPSIAPDKPRFDPHPPRPRKPPPGENDIRRP